MLDRVATHALFAQPQPNSQSVYTSHAHATLPLNRSSPATPALYPATPSLYPATPSRNKSRFPVTCRVGASNLSKIYPHPACTTRNFLLKYSHRYSFLLVCCIGTHAVLRVYAPCYLSTATPMAADRRFTGIPLRLFWVLCASPALSGRHKKSPFPPILACT